jgi:phosphatidylglycerophosphate synthase
MENMSGMKFNWFWRNLANSITLLGFPLCFALAWVVASHRNWTGTILLLVTGVLLTDFLDGKMARYFKIVSKFGGAADRLRDKVFLGIMFVFLILDGRINFSLKVITVSVAVVETALLIYWCLGVMKKMDVSTPKSIGGYGPGQIKMFLLSCAILLLCLNLIVEERWGQKYHFWAAIFLNALFVVSLVFAVKSFLSNWAKYRAQLVGKS